jgi:hypothetical protein
MQSKQPTHRSQVSKKLLRAMTNVACVLFKMSSLRDRDEGSTADDRLGLELASISFVFAIPQAATANATA